MKLLVAMVSAAGVLSFASPSAADVPTETLGNWEIIAITDPITDEGRKIGVLKGDGAELIVKCDTPGPSSLYVQFIAHRYLGGSGGSSASRKLTWRLDDQPPVQDTWRYKDRWAALFDDSKSYPFIAGLAGGKKLVVRALTYEYSQVDAVFELNGADRAIEAVRAACKSL